MILRVFDASSLIHTPRIVPIVPWGPLSLLVVPLVSVNSFHHWLVIRRCSCMFDFSSCIHMLGFVLCSSRDGAQDPGSLSVVIQVAILWMIMIITWLIDGWLRPYLSLHGWLWPYLIITMVSSAGWLRPYHRPSSYVFWMAAPMPRLHVHNYQRYRILPDGVPVQRVL